MLLAIARIGLIVLMALRIGIICADDYPNKPIRIVAGSVGGGGDFPARILSPDLSANMGQAIVIDNRPTEVVPGQIVSKAAPDGYTLLINGGSFWIGPLLKPTPYDVLKDFSPVTQVERSPNVLVVNPSLPAKTVKDLIALAKAKPGQLNYGATAIGASTHLAAELFKSMAGVNIVRVNYKSTGNSITGLIGGETQMQFASTNSAMSQVRAGTLKALAVTSLQPTALVPGVPTVAASGLPGYESVGMTAIFVPAKTPTPIINRLNREFVRVLREPDVKEKFLNGGLDIVDSSPEQTGAAVKAEIEKWGKVIKEAGIKLE